MPSLVYCSHEGGRCGLRDSCLDRTVVATQQQTAVSKLSIYLAAVALSRNSCQEKTLSGVEVYIFFTLSKLSLFFFIFFLPLVGPAGLSSSSHSALSFPTSSRKASNLVSARPGPFMAAAGGGGILDLQSICALA